MNKSVSSSRFLIIVILVAVAVAALLVVLSQIGGGSGEAEVQQTLANVPQNGTTLGSEDAPVTIYLYEDFQCPVCARFTRETFPDLVTSYVEPGQVKVVSEPLSVIGPDSTPAAKAALAAGDQNLYWNYSTVFFANQGRENSGYVTDRFLTNIADKTQGLDQGRWNGARDSDAVQSELDDARGRAQADNVNATPTLVISGPQGTRNVVGAVPIDQISSAIDEVGATSS